MLLSPNWTGLAGIDWLTRLRGRGGEGTMFTIYLPGPKPAKEFLL